MKIYIRNMVCDRCKSAVRNELHNAGLKFTSLELGEVELSEPPKPADLHSFKERIATLGFELIEDKPAREVNRIKQAVLGWVRGEEGENRKLRFSAFLAEKMHKDYGSLSSLFSSIEGITIEQYLISQKIEMVKELLVYNELTLKEISAQLNYSSVQHLANQFKKITGLTPGHFRKIGALKRKSIDSL
jgi:AraC family transcriptional regulator